jgi:hypothetical protein
MATTNDRAIQAAVGWLKADNADAANTVFFFFFFFFFFFCFSSKTIQNKTKKKTPPKSKPNLFSFF